MSENNTEKSKVDTAKAQILKDFGDKPWFNGVAVQRTGGVFNLRVSISNKDEQVAADAENAVPHEVDGIRVDTIRVDYNAL
jgi:hypothetical protein